jgi:hypothetical protein
MLLLVKSSELVSDFIEVNRIWVYNFLYNYNEVSKIFKNHQSSNREYGTILIPKAFKKRSI